jgi:hypothetical protein
MAQSPFLLPLLTPFCYSPFRFPPFLKSLLLTWNPSFDVVRSCPPWSQVARELTSPSPFQFPDPPGFPQINCAPYQDNISIPASHSPEQLPLWNVKNLDPYQTVGSGFVSNWKAWSGSVSNWKAWSGSEKWKVWSGSVSKGSGSATLLWRL